MVEVFDDHKALLAHKGKHVASPYDFVNACGRCDKGLLVEVYVSQLCHTLREPVDQELAFELVGANHEIRCDQPVVSQWSS